MYVGTYIYILITFIYCNCLLFSYLDHDKYFCCNIHIHTYVKMKIHMCGAIKMHIFIVVHNQTYLNPRVCIIREAQFGPPYIAIYKRDVFISSLVLVFRLIFKITKN